MGKKGHNLPKCSFCGKSQEMVRHLVAGSLCPDCGHAVYICDECHTLVGGLIAESKVQGLTVPR